MIELYTRKSTMINCVKFSGILLLFKGFWFSAIIKKLLYQTPNIVHISGNVNKLMKKKMNVFSSYHRKITPGVLTFGLLPF